MNKLLCGALAVSSLVGVVVACNGNDGAVGAAGPAGNNATGTGGNGANGTDGVNGVNGEGGAAVVVSALAKHGLDISPVAPNLVGLTGDQIEQIGQGSYLVNAVADCAGCHNDPAGTAPGNFLAGGNVFPVGAGTFVTSRNLTSDKTTGMKLTEAQFIEVFRTGKDFAIPADAGAAEALLVMPWESFRWMSTGDIKAIYAYLKAIPAAVPTLPIKDNKGVSPQPVPYTGQYADGQIARTLPPEDDGQGGAVPDPGSVLRGLAVDAIDNTKAIQAPPPGEVGQYGRGAYLVNAVADCSGCHTNPERVSGKVNVAQYMTGGRVFPTPGPLQPLLKTARVMSANLLGPNGFFVTADLPIFLASITQGVHADDPPPQAPLGFPMPARVFRNMTIGDLEAVYTYMRQVATAVPGGRTDKQIRPTALYCASDADCGGVAGACDLPNKECTQKTCGSNADCPVCQTCTGSGGTKCEAQHDAAGDAGPPALSICIAAGL